MWNSVKKIYHLAKRLKKIILFKINKNSIVSSLDSEIISTSKKSGRKILCLYFDGMPAKRMELYGGPIPTPNFNRIAQSGTKYNNMIVTAPSTAMSVTTMFTGLFPHEFGRRSWLVEDKGLPESCTTLAQELETEGYNLFFLWDESFMERRTENKYKILDWDNYNIRFLDIADKEIQADQTIKMINEINKKYNQWFSFVRFSDGASSKFVDSAKKYSPYTFDDEIIEADYILGALLDSLPKDIELVLFSDHGKSYGQNGIYKYAFNLSEMTLHVPFVTSWGDGTTIDELVPMAEFPNIIKKNILRDHKYIYSDSGYADQWIRSTMVRRERWKYVYNRTSWRFPEEFYDLQYDPDELINLVGKYKDPYRDSRPKGDTVDIKNSPSGQVLDGKNVNEVYPRNDWKRVNKILRELRKERERIWENQQVMERNYQ